MAQKSLDSTVYCTRTIIKVTGSLVEVISDGEITESVQTEDPLTFIEEFQQRFDVENVAGLPRFFGGLVGYFGYDTVRYVEPRLADSAPEDTLNTPDIMLMVSEEVVVFDNIRGSMQLIGLIDPDQDGAAKAMQKRLQQRAEQLQLPIQGLEHGDSNQKILELEEEIRQLKQLVYTLLPQEQKHLIQIEAESKTILPASKHPKPKTFEVRDLEINVDQIKVCIKVLNWCCNSTLQERATFCLPEGCCTNAMLQSEESLICYSKIYSDILIACISVYQIYRL